MTYDALAAQQAAEHEAARQRVRELEGERSHLHRPGDVRSDAARLAAVTSLTADGSKLAGGPGALAFAVPADGTLEALRAELSAAKSTIVEQASNMTIERHRTAVMQRSFEAQRRRADALHKRLAAYEEAEHEARQHASHPVDTASKPRGSPDSRGPDPDRADANAFGSFRRGFAGRSPTATSPAGSEGDVLGMKVLQAEVERLERQLRSAHARIDELAELREAFAQRFTQPFVQQLEREIELQSLGLSLSQADQAPADLHAAEQREQLKMARALRL